VRRVRFDQILASFIVIAFLFGHLSVALADQDDWEAARKASCPELIDAYKTTGDAERKVVAAIKESKDGTVATNVLGVASLAIIGFGFFTWNDNASAEENLADLRNDIKIITTVASEKRCELPALPDNNKK
jgi:hypothetical protein